MGLSVTQKKFSLIFFLAILLSIFAIVLLNSNAQSLNGVDHFSSLKRDQVSSIQMQLTGLPPIRLEKKGNSWHLTSPIHRRADPTRINILLAVLSLPKKNIYASADLNLQEIGLDIPAGTLILNERVFSFGSTDASGKKRYLMHDGQITLISDLIFPLFKNGLGNTAQMQIAHPGLVGIRSNNWTLSKDSNKWTSSEIPDQKVENIVSAWLKQRANEILPWPLENTEPLENGKLYTLNLSYSSNKNTEVSIYELEKLAIIHPLDSDYALVIDSEQFSTLGIGE